MDDIKEKLKQAKNEIFKKNISLEEQEKIELNIKNNVDKIINNLEKNKDEEMVDE